jgi:hypothetical protein
MPRASILRVVTGWKFPMVSRADDAECVEDLSELTGGANVESYDGGGISFLKSKLSFIG